MKKFSRFFTVILNVALLLSSFSLPPVLAQNTKTAVFRGYRTGYSDGYMSGYRDSVEKSKRSYEKHQDYVKASRAYSKEYGSLEEYRDGYRQGFTKGYNTGYDRRSFDSSVPQTLAYRGTKPASNEEDSGDTQTGSTPSKYDNPPRTSESAAPKGVPVEALVIIPANTELIVEMQNNVDTRESRRGDDFQARIVAPSEIEGAVIEGKIADLQKPGRIKRRAEMQLSFNRIVLNQNRWANMNAMVVEAFPLNDKTQANNVKKVDPEGTIQGKSSLKSDAIIVGSAAGTGGTVGAIAGGPVGFAVGAAVGGAFGLGGVLVARGKDIKLNEGQRLRIRTAYETQIR